MRPLPCGTAGGPSAACLTCRKAWSCLLSLVAGDCLSASDRSDSRSALAAASAESFASSEPCIQASHESKHHTSHSQCARHLSSSLSALEGVQAAATSVTRAPYIPFHRLCLVAVRLVLVVIAISALQQRPLGLVLPNSLPHGLDPLYRLGALLPSRAQATPTRQRASAGQDASAYVPDARTLVGEASASLMEPWNSTKPR